MGSIDNLRRRLLGGLGLGVGASVIGSASAAADQAPDGTGGLRKMEISYDVAVLGHTNYDNEDAAINRHPDYANRVTERFREGYLQSDLRGSSFYHEGLIYPAGTIREAKTHREVVWDFSAEPIGTFFDRGWVVINNKAEPPFVRRADPHLLSHTDYYLGGVVSGENLTPTDMIATVGLQHDNAGTGVFRRAIVGGTGKYATVRGQMFQTALGSNTSILHGRFIPDGVRPPSPNFRIRFEIYV